MSNVRIFLTADCTDGRGWGAKWSDVEFVEQGGGGFVELFAAADLVEAVQQVLDAQAFFLGSPDVVQDAATVHHEDAVAEADGLLHRMGDHQGGEFFAPDDL